MYKIVDVETGKVVESNLPTDREAKIAADTYAIKVMSKNKFGRRALQWCNNQPSPEQVRFYAMVQEMIGDWIVLDGEDNVPEETTEEEGVVFTSKTGQRYLGYFDADDVTFTAADGQVFPAKKVVAYMLLPDDDVGE